VKDQIIQRLWKCESQHKIRTLIEMSGVLNAG
jgi:hypothetical protein